METIIRFLVLMLAMAAASGVAPAAEPSPSQKSPPQAPAYRSAFEGYRPLIDEPLRPWREVNDEVARLRGHIGHIGSEAVAPDRPGPDSAGTVPRPGTGNADQASPGGHSGHHR